MIECALLVDGVIRELRTCDGKPAGIPHKKVTWHEVVREFGEPFEGLEHGVWIIRTADPATLPPPVPERITRRQAALQLLAMGTITAQEALDMTRAGSVPAAIAAILDAQVAEGTFTPEQRILSEIDFAATSYERDNPLLGLMGLSGQETDQFFIGAAAR